MLFTLLFLAAPKSAAPAATSKQAVAHASALAFVKDLGTGQYDGAIKQFGSSDATISHNVTVAAREMAKVIGFKSDAVTIPQPKQAMSSENLSAHADWKKKLGAHDLYEFVGASSAHGKTYFQFEFTPEGKMLVAVIGLDKSAENDALLKKAEANATAALEKPASQPAAAPAATPAKK